MGKTLPNNWVETSLDKVVNSIKGKKPARLEDFEFDDSIPYLDIKALEFNQVRQYADSKSSKIFDTDDIAIVWDGARSGWVSKTFFGAIGSTIAALRPIRTNSTFLYYFLLEKYPFINSNARGVGIPHVDPTVLWSLSFPLPPLSEQKRIANKLDALFIQLDGIRIAMEGIPTLLKNFRQQVLTQAVTGKLTEEWREGKELEEWRVCNLLELILAKPKNGFSPQSVDYKTDVKSLSLSATTSGKFNSKHIKYLNIDKPDKSSHLWLKKGDILIQRSNSLEYVGTAAIFDGEDFEYIYPDIMMKVQINDKVINKYIYYSLSSSFTKKYFRENASGTAGNMPKINQNTVCNTPVNLPPLLEQQEIVCRVESLFKQADAIELQYINLKQKIDNLPQAILHKAFKGELVEQLPTDGDARDLLRQIKELKELTKKKK